MTFKGPYMQAMRQQPPQMFNELVRSGQLEAHVRKKSEEAHQMLRDPLAPEPKGVDGLPGDPQAQRLAEERMLGEMLNFPQPESQRHPCAAALRSGRWFRPRPTVAAKDRRGFVAERQLIFTYAKIGAAPQILLGHAIC